MQVVVPGLTRKWFFVLKQRYRDNLVVEIGFVVRIVDDVGLSYIQTLRGYLVMGIPYMVVCLFVHLYVFVTSCAQYKHEAQFLVVHSWSQHPENPTVMTSEVAEMPKTSL